MGISTRMAPRPSIATILLEGGVIPPPSPMRSPVLRLHLSPEALAKTPLAPGTPRTPLTPMTPITLPSTPRLEIPPRGPSPSASSPMSALSTVSLNSPLGFGHGLAHGLPSPATVSTSPAIAAGSFTMTTTPPSPPRSRRPSLRVAVPGDSDEPSYPLMPLRLETVTARKERKVHAAPVVRPGFKAIMTMTPISTGCDTSEIPSILAPSPMLPRIRSPVTPYSACSEYNKTPTVSGDSSLLTPKPKSKRKVRFLEPPHPRYADTPTGLKPDGPPSALGRGRPRPRRMALSATEPCMDSETPLLSPIPPLKPALKPQSSPMPSPSPVSVGVGISPNALSPAPLSALSPPISPFLSPFHLSPKCSYTPRISSPLAITTVGLSPRLSPLNVSSVRSPLRISRGPMSPIILTPVQVRQAVGPLAQAWGIFYWIWAYYAGWNPLSLH